MTKYAMMKYCIKTLIVIVIILIPQTISIMETQKQYPQKNGAKPANNQIVTNTPKRGENKLTKEVKEILFDTLKEDYQKLGKWMSSCPFDERAKLLKDFAKYFGDEEAFKQELWKQLQPHYNKLGFYIPHLTAKEKITVLRSFLSDISPEHRREAIESINRQNIKFD